MSLNKTQLHNQTDAARNSDASEFRGLTETQHESIGLSEWNQKGQIHLKPFTKAADYSRHKHRILKHFNNRYTEAAARR